MAKKEQNRKFHQELASQLLTLSTSGFGLVAALAWNDTIQQVVKQFIEPKMPGSGLISRFIYALIITALAVFITYQLSKIAAHFNSKR